MDGGAGVNAGAGNAGASMATRYECFVCRKVFVSEGAAPKKCVVCGGTQIEVVSSLRLETGMNAGTYYNIDLRTGGRATKKRKR